MKILKILKLLIFPQSAAVFWAWRSDVEPQGCCCFMIFFFFLRRQKLRVIVFGKHYIHLDLWPNQTVLNLSFGKTLNDHGLTLPPVCGGGESGSVWSFSLGRQKQSLGNHSGGVREHVIGWGGRRREGALESSKESQGRLTEELTEGQRKGYSLHRLQERERERVRGFGRVFLLGS